METVTKAFVKEMSDLIDKKHKEDLRKVDYQYRSLKDSINEWSEGKGVGLSYELDHVLDGENNEENLKALMVELRAEGEELS